MLGFERELERGWLGFVEKKKKWFGRRFVVLVVLFFAVQ